MSVLVYHVASAWWPGRVQFVVSDDLSVPKTLAPQAFKFGFISWSSLKASRYEEYTIDGQVGPCDEPNLIEFYWPSTSNFIECGKFVCNILAGSKVWKVEFNHKVGSKTIGFMMLTHPIGLGHAVGS